MQKNEMVPDMTEETFDDEKLQKQGSNYIFLRNIKKLITRKCITKRSHSTG